jgi:glycosyltransferase involved in cell wall biosynthesis
VVGRLAEYVEALSAQLAKHKIETHVVTYHEFLTGSTRESSGVDTIRVSNPVRTHIGVLTWVLTLNEEVERVAANVYYNAKEKIDLIDVYDWHFVPAAVTLKTALDIPFVYSVESIEDQRSPTANTPYSMAIKSIEWLGFFEAKKVSVKTESMREDIIRIYQVPKEKIVVVNPNAHSWMKEVPLLYNSVAGDVKNK